MEKSCSVVIPSYNEEKAIGEVISKINNILENSKIQHEIIVVDDGSTDRTSEIAGERGAKVIKLKENKGVGFARKVGIKNAQYEHIVMIDADGTYPCEKIPEMLEFLPEYDMVIGARKKESGTLPFLRKPVKWFIKKIAEYIVRKKIPDLNSGLRAFKKSISLQYFNILPDTHSWVSTITIAFLNDNYDVKYIPIDYFKRKGKSTFHPFKDTFTYLLLVIRTILYFRPLKIFFPTGFFILLIGILRTLYNAKFLHDVKESDVMIVMTGVFILVVGFLADMIVKIQKKQI